MDDSREDHLVHGWIPLGLLPGYDVRVRVVRDAVVDGRREPRRHRIVPFAPG